METSEFKRKKDAMELQPINGNSTENDANNAAAAVAIGGETNLCGLDLTCPKVCIKKLDVKEECVGKSGDAPGGRNKAPSMAREVEVQRKSAGGVAVGATKQESGIVKVNENSTVKAKSPFSSYSDAMHLLTPAQQAEVRRYRQLLAGAQGSRHPRGIRGIQNLGNTCYLSGVIQCLAQCWPLITYFLHDHYLKDLNRQSDFGMKGKLAESFGSVLRSLWGGNSSPLSVARLRLLIGHCHKEFIVPNQQDAQELYTYMLDLLHEDLNKVIIRRPIEEINANGRADEEIANEFWNNYLKLNNSIIVDLFHGLSRSTLVCLMCGNASVKFDAMVHMQLPLPWQPQCTIKFTIHFHNNKKTAQRSSVTLDADGSISDLADTVARFYRLDASQLMIARVVEHHFQRMFELTDKLSCIQDNDDIAIYEIPLSAVNNPSRYYLIPIVLKRDERGYFAELGGCPLLIIISKDKYSSFDLCSDISNYLKLQIGYDDCSNQKENNLIDVESFDKEDKFTFSLGYMTDSNTNQVTDINNATMNRGNQMLVASFPDGTVTDGLPNVTSGCELQRRPKTIDVTDCIRELLLEERIDQDNAWECSTCQAKREARKKMDFWTLPKVIVMQLKRFRDTNATNISITGSGIANWEKNDIMVHAPLELDMNEFLGGPKPEYSLYKLFGVVNHSGVLQGGHFEAHIFCKERNAWFKCNDSHVQQITGLANIITQQAYMLFYMREDEFDKPFDSSDLPTTD